MSSRPAQRYAHDTMHAWHLSLRWCHGLQQSTAKQVLAGTRPLRTITFSCVAGGVLGGAPDHLLSTTCTCQQHSASAQRWWAAPAAQQTVVCAADTTSSSNAVRRSQCVQCQQLAAHTHSCAWLARLHSHCARKTGHGPLKRLRELLCCSEQ